MGGVLRTGEGRVVLQVFSFAAFCRLGDVKLSVWGRAKGRGGWRRPETTAVWLAAKGWEGIERVLKGRVRKSAYNYIWHSVRNL